MTAKLVCDQPAPQGGLPRGGSPGIVNQISWQRTDTARGSGNDG